MSLTHILTMQLHGHLINAELGWEVHSQLLKYL